MECGADAPRTNGRKFSASSHCATRPESATIPGSPGSPGAVKYRRTRPPVGSRSQRPRTPPARSPMCGVAGDERTRARPGFCPGIPSGPPFGIDRPSQPTPGSGRQERKIMAINSYYAPTGGLPGQTELTTNRAVFTEAYAVLPRGTMRDIVTSFLPFWEKTRLWVLARPLSGFAETFSQYIVEVAPGGGSERPETDPVAEAVLFVVEGALQLTIESETHSLGNPFTAD